MRQGGRRRLFDEVASLYSEWCALGEPARDSFRLTVSPAGGHTLWHGSATGGHWWPLG